MHVYYLNIISIYVANLIL